MDWLRRRWQWLVGPAAVGLAALVGWFVPTGDFLILPGEAVNTAPMVQVASAPAKPRGGSLLLVTIYSSPANFDEWLFGHVYPHAHLEPARTQLPPNTSYERFRHLEEAMMADSQTTAKVVALRQLGYTVTEHGQGAAVTSVQRGSAAEAAGIGRGDLILAIDGQPVTTASQLVDRIDAARPGQTVRITLKPNNSDAQKEVEATLRARPNDPNRALLGVTPETYRPSYDFPVPISIDSRGIIGPSAGLVLTLSIMQAASPTDITHGHNVAATGTIDLSGRVGAVGGVPDKVYAAEGRAEYFLVPKADADTARKTATRMKVVETDTLQQAVDFLKSLA
ncbi:MAG TPA: PDZ domain-containing protein [Chloroflexota bacterium]|nr:PDZ domain-containing protein [Chloroflexota bacterium]